MTFEWALHQEPHRHYRVSVDGGKPVWNGARKQRIVSATTLLGGDVDTLTAWAARQALAAGEWAAMTWLDAGPLLAGSLLQFGDLAELSGMMPDQVRDDKADSGTAAHTYLAARLLGVDLPVPAPVPYGLRSAIDAYLDEHRPIAMPGCVERAVGDYELAIAGTYDARVALGEARLWTGFGMVHRIDLKQSNTVQGHMFAQLACYEWMGGQCGEAPSDYLTILHIDAAGSHKPYSIAVGSAQHEAADAYWRACLAKWRAAPVLAKALKP